MVLELVCLDMNKKNSFDKILGLTIYDKNSIA